MDRGLSLLIVKDKLYLSFVIIAQIEQICIDSYCYENGVEAIKKGIFYFLILLCNFFRKIIVFMII